MHFLADENFNNHILRALLLQKPALDVIRVQDLGLTGKNDEEILSFALSQNRLLLTHDVKTIPAQALNWMANSKPIPGILLINWNAPISRVLDDLLLIVDCSDQNEWTGQIHYLPF